MWASRFKMPELYLATRATFSAIYGFIRSGLLWWLLCFNFGAVAWKCDKCKSGERGRCVCRSASSAPRGHKLGVCCWIAAEKQPSPLQNKPFPQPQEFGAWGRVPPGHELLQSCWYPSPWDRGPLPASISTGFFFKLWLFFFFPSAFFPPTLWRKNAGWYMLHFSLCRRKSGFSFSYRYMEQCMIFDLLFKKVGFPLFPPPPPNSLKQKGLFLC